MGRVVAWALGLLVLLLSACGSGSPVQSDTFYRLAEPRVGEALAQPVTDGAIQVAPLYSGTLYRERPLLYSDDPEHLTVKQYHYHYWEESPPRLLRQQLIYYLRAAKAAPLITHDADANADLTVRGRINRFEHTLADAVTAHVSLELRVLDRVGKVLLTKEYEAAEPAASRDVAAVVAALDEGLNDIYGRFLADLARLTAAR